MSYTPINSQVFFAAYSGTYAGIAASNRVPMSSDEATYATPAQTALAFAEAVDIAWDSVTATQLDVQCMNQVASGIWINRAPSTSGNWTVEAEALVAMVRAQSALMESEGIAVPAAGTGGGLGSQTATKAVGGTFNNAAEGKATLAVYGSVLQTNHPLGAVSPTYDWLPPDDSIRSVCYDPSTYTDNEGFTIGPFIWIGRKHDVVRISTGVQLNDDANNGAVVIPYAEVQNGNICGQVAVLNGKTYSTLTEPAGMVFTDSLQSSPLVPQYGWHPDEDVFWKYMVAANDALYVSAYGGAVLSNVKIFKYDTAGNLLASVTTDLSLFGGNNPNPMVATPDGNIWIVGFEGFRKYDSDLNLLLSTPMPNNVFLLSDTPTDQFVYGAGKVWTCCAIDGDDKPLILFVDDTTGAADYLLLGGAGDRALGVAYDQTNNFIWVSTIPYQYTTINDLSLWNKTVSLINIDNLDTTPAIGALLVDLPKGLIATQLIWDPFYPCIYAFGMDQLALVRGLDAAPEVFKIYPLGSSEASWQQEAMPTMYCQSSSWEMQPYHRHVLCKTSADPVAVTLPPSFNSSTGERQIASGQMFTITDASGNASSNPITISGAGGEFINGGANFVIDQDFGSVTICLTSGLVSETAWFVLNKSF